MDTTPSLLRRPICRYVGQAHPDGWLNIFQAFLQKFRPDMDPTTTWDLQTADGGSDPQNATQAANDDEANLDIQVCVPLPLPKHARS
jgi:hypothetical protein